MQNCVSFPIQEEEGKCGPRHKDQVLAGMSLFPALGDLRSYV
jgi:hypothetical protein